MWAQNESHNQKKNQAIDTEMMELANNDIKTVVINALNMLKDIKGKLK